MFRNPLARHVTWFIIIKAVLIGLGIWWFVSAMPEPRGMLPPVPAAKSS